MRPPLTTSITGPVTTPSRFLGGFSIVAPGPLVLGPLLGQDEATLLVLLLEDEGLDGITQRHDLGRIDVVADGELARGDDALGLVADVEEHLVPVDLDHGALDDLAVLDLDHRRRVGLVEGETTEVVLGDLAGHVAALGVEAAHVGGSLGHRRRVDGGGGGGCPGGGGALGTDLCVGVDGGAGSGGGRFGGRLVGQGALSSVDWGIGLGDERPTRARARTTTGDASTALPRPHGVGRTVADRS